ncbi:polysaccharide deacetylase [Caballeronia sp. AZ7_KS35]|uniref:polysaccharide deacetylase n=1 Tax=Caballeronia sp. AZ7_KS35 TaxID=2921762 RepID=UPI0020295DDC|nr:polysaccharide deacetylase [Caballeronia sp. AZ7_KS35]
MKSRYALLTVDTEALPGRATRDHIDRLIWGRHESGTAGVREMSSIGNEFNAKHVFFVDMCATHERLDEMRDVVRWLVRDGQDVQLHAHPEVLPESFWMSHGFEARPKFMNEYADDARATFVLKHFGKQIAEVTGKDLLAFRAGSFRWNAGTLRALKAANIPLSFNNTMRAYRMNRCAHSEPTNRPYRWSNGVVEVPLTEKYVPPRAEREARWASLTYPESSYFPYAAPRRNWLSAFRGGSDNLSVFLMHSWSLLYWDEKGRATYRDDQRLEGYRNLLARVVKDYEVITTRDFLDLYSRGKVRATHAVDIKKAELKR